MPRTKKQPNRSGRARTKRSGNPRERVKEVAQTHPLKVKFDEGKIVNEFERRMCITFLSMTTFLTAVCHNRHRRFRRGHNA